MSLFQCEACGCVENTATSNYWTKDMKDMWTEEYLGKALCSACGPSHFKDGTKADQGVWHGRFPRTFLPKGMFRTAKNGNLEHIETGEQNYKKYVLTPNDGVTGA